MALFPHGTQVYCPLTRVGVEFPHIPVYVQYHILPLPRGSPSRFTELSFPPRVRKSLKPGWEGGGAIALCNQGIALLFYLLFSQNSEIDCCRSASPASPFLLSAPSALIHSWPHKGVLCVFSCRSGSCSTDVSCLFLSMRWFGGGNTVIFGELAPNCEVFDPTVFLHFLEGEFYSMCVF